MNNDIFVEKTITSCGVNFRFFRKLNEKQMVLLAYLPYVKLSQYEYLIKPDLTKEMNMRYFPFDFKILEPYDENREYINVFKP